MKHASATAAVACAALLAVAVGTRPAEGSDPLDPLTLTQAGVDTQRHPFAH